MYSKTSRLCVCLLQVKLLLRKKRRIIVPWGEAEQAHRVLIDPSHWQVGKRLVPQLARWSPEDMPLKEHENLTQMFSCGELLSIVSDISLLRSSVARDENGEIEDIQCPPSEDEDEAISICISPYKTQSELSFPSPPGNVWDNIWEGSSERPEGCLLLQDRGEGSTSSSGSEDFFDCVV